MKSSVIRYVVILGLITFVGILAFQVYWLMTNYHHQRDRVQQQIQIVLINVAEQIASYNKSTLPQENLITQRSNNYFIVNINDEIDVGLLQQYLLTEMRRVGLHTDVEYAIYDCDKDQMAYGHYCDIDMLDENIASSELPRYNKYDYYFGVRFPRLNDHVMAGMKLTLILALLLVCALLFIGWATYVIIAQKRLSDLTRDFINNMTHELKTPLSSIKIAGDTFIRDEQISSDPRLLRYATIVKDQAEHLNSHVEKILDVARLDRDMMRLLDEPMDLNEIVTAVFDSFSTAHGANVDLQLNTMDAPAMVDGDVLHVTNMLYNLVDNAIKYGGKPPRVSMLLKSEEAHYKLAVSDNGDGIAERYHKRIFDKFYRIPTGDVHDIKGFGIGLHYVQQITRILKWELQLDTSERGSTFTILIPRLHNST